MSDHIPDATKMVCPHCKSPARDDWPCEYRCGSITHSGGEFYRSNRCFNNEIAQLKAKVKRLEEAADNMIDAVYSVQDWSGTRIGDCAEELEKAKEATT